ncbi:protein ecdysoneless homolog isoform X2 [Pangasianodon hypophthalmus]|uniref:protein ecdysoneless homolog isoform X2 n=1 Tax=Pangasianodon hypophthalmus TaxID=310915 RepID=UPI002306FA7F|nr:protein ecdysoneless homolog isoform X2 [Pangasianodon hypophthalmus]
MTDRQTAMEVLKRAPVLEDALQYRLFLLHPEPLDAQEKQRLLLRLLEDVLAELAALLVGYIWQKQPFNLSFHPEKGGVPAHLGGSTEFGDNVEDEWFIVYLLKRITHTFSELAASVQDNDGQFLLIEAAEYLPKWLDPDSSENRVFLYHGELHILPNRVRAGEAGWPRDSVPSVQEALEVLQTHSERCMADRRIRAVVERRLQGYPGKIQTSLHHAHCYVPAGVAAVLSRRPDLVAPAVSAFYLRDPIDLQACRTFQNFPPESRVLTLVTFTRCLYAQLQQQSFVPDRRSGFTLPPPSHPQYKAHELGMKLAHGFEILCSKSGRTATNSDAPVNANPLWRGFLDSLKRNDYFKGELEGSARYRELTKAAESFFTQSLPSAQSCAHGPGEEVLQVLESAPYSLEELKKQEAHLPSEDSDDWLNITPDELERLLEERGGQRSSKGQGVACGAGRSEDEEKQQEEEAGYTLVAVTQGMKDFINAMSSHEGAEFPRSCLSEPFSFDPDAVTSALDRLLGGKDEELDSDDLDDDDDDDDDDDEAEEEGSEEQTGAEALDNLRRYMDEMDQELQTTNVGQSFTYNSKGGDMRPDAAGSSAQTEDDFQPLDVDVNLVTNLLESLSSQAGLAGPASNLLHSLGLRLPPNADPS